MDSDKIAENIKQWFQKHPTYLENTVPLKRNYTRQPSKLYFPNVTSISASKIQAQKYLLWKKHRMVVKDRTVYKANNNVKAKVKVPNQRFKSKKKSSYSHKLQDSTSGESSFDYCSESDSGKILKSSDVIPPFAAKDSILETVIKSEKKTYSSFDLSIYRTPSGKYYCQSCNVNVNSENQFLQHSKSKNHKNKLRQTLIKK